MENVIYDLIIIGAGPGGMTASVYASKAKLKTLMIERAYPGGKVTNTSLIENWPGYQKIEGYKLATEMFQHSVAFGTQFVQDEVLEIKDLGELKSVVTKKTTYKTYAVIIATGTKERKLGIENEDKLYGRGVSYCAVCDGSLYKDNEMVVVGGGNSAFQEALYLANFATKIYLAHRSSNFRAEETLIEEVKNNPKIEILTDHIATKLIGDTKLEEIVFKNLKTGKTFNIKAPVFFPFIGSDPVSDFVKNLGITSEAGHIIADKNMKTPIDGVYAIGDVLDKHLRQIVTATGDGSIAAMHSYKYIRDLQKKAN